MKKVILIIIIVVILILGFFGFGFYNKYVANNVEKQGFVLIPHHAKLQQIIDSIAPNIKNKELFISVALDKNLEQHYKPGRYEIKSGMNNREIMNMIIAGNQIPNRFKIKDFDDIYQLVGRVTKKTEIDSLKFIKKLNEIAVAQGYNNAEDLKKYFFNDTYDFFWTVTPKEFFNTFEKEYQSFWTAERIAKEKALGLSRNQIYALASIVYKESGGRPNEQRTIAGLYINRYKKGIKLQSDPTVIYAVKQSNKFDKIIKRVYYKDLKIESPYNTYAYAGIPPGPICVVDKYSLDAVLDAEENNYIFMCADPERFGFHKFTDNDVEHVKNAKAYQAWLNSKKIK